MAFVQQTTYHVGGTTYKETQYRETNLRPMGADESKCIQDMYCSPCESTSGKVARVVLWSGSIAAIGAIAGPPGAAIGGGIGLGIGFCSIL